MALWKMISSCIMWCIEEKEMIVALNTAKVKWWK